METLTSLDARIAKLERRRSMILVLLAINLFANLLTVGAVLLAVWP